MERPVDHCAADHCRALAELIDGATKTIDFAIYGMRNQTRVFEAIRAAKDRGVLVRGIVDRDMNGQNYYSSTETLVDLVGKVSSDLQADRKLAHAADRVPFVREPKCNRPAGFDGPLQCLAYDLGDRCLLAAHAADGPIDHKDAIMHNKFFIVDSRFVWTGSTNVSDSCTGGYNANLVTVLDSPLVANWYLQEFEQMYGEGRYHGLKQSPGQHRAELSNAEVEVYFSPQDRPIRTVVQPLLEQAKARIDIAVFFLTHKFIAEDLIAAHLRGVEVRVILDASGATNAYTKHELLRAAGIPVKVETWGGKMHMKSAVIDSRTVITGSMNWTSAGEFTNDENTVIVHSAEHAQQYEAFFERIWATIPEAWLSANPDPESHDSTTACVDGVDNDYDGSTDAEDPGCSADPPPLRPLPPWQIVAKGDRLTCEVGMAAVAKGP